jgi:hypothetical protein
MDYLEIADKGNLHYNENLLFSDILKHQFLLQGFTDGEIIKEDFKSAQE